MSLHKHLDNSLKQIKILQEKIDFFTNKKEKGEQKIVRNTLQPPPKVPDFKTESSEDIEQLLRDKLKNIDLSSHIKNLDLKPQPVLTAKEKNSINQRAKHDFSVNSINTKWADKPIQRMYYYNRPTPVDVLNEEREHVFNNSYNYREIYEWNIYGFNDKQIFTTVHRMLMYSTISKVNKNSDKEIAYMIVAGFTGQLKGWWDNFLNEEHRTTIMNTTTVSKVEGQLAYQTTDVSTSEGQERANAVYTLVTTMVEHFCGRWTDEAETIRTTLQNLRCRQLSDFRWYKDVFLSRVMELHDCSHEHWKSKFIDGLPSIFAERVIKTLRGTETKIPYEKLTYGKIISVCTQEGLNVCNEIKMNYHIKKNRLNEKQQLGEFCDQFAFDMPITARKGKVYPSKEKFYKKSRKVKRRELSKADLKELPKKYRKMYKRKVGKKDYKKNVKCHKCGRYGHYANECKTQKKIKALDLDDKLKDSLCKILLYSDNEGAPSSVNKTSSDSSSSSTEDQVKVLQNEDLYSNSDRSFSDDECEPCQKGMSCEKDDSLYNLLSNFQDFNLSVIDDDKIFNIL
ncbi:uncharacterized protein LOC129892794 [Solanum dulcamara]|uniref:uncharacterized protein LOC129892794 n=1 Tax=Solanum dulcamara TaxID=45834 RepID=UPI0024868D6B|nr:uncharacterized protein LOC129892794 [Solanum dulcamara]